MTIGAGESDGARETGPRRRISITLLTLFALGATLATLGPTTAAAEDDCIVLEDFAQAPVGQFPREWKVRKDAGKQVYSVAEDAGRKFLHAEARDVGIQAAKASEWDLTTHPILAWSWRPRKFPEGADERTDKNDSALAVYAVFPSSMVTVKSVKYVWSEKVPVDTHLVSSRGYTQVRVVASGSAGGDQWHEARANVLEDFKRYFDVSEVPKPQGIAVLTDADDTHGVAIGDYANFRACRR